MDRGAIARIGSVGTRSVEEAVAQHQPVDAGRRGDDALQVDDPGQHGVIGDARRVEERIALVVRLGARGVQPRTALRDHPGRACRQGRVHQVARSDLAEPRVRTELFDAETRSEVRQLMDHDLGAGIDDSGPERVRVQRVDDDRLCALRTQPGCPLDRPCCTRDHVARVNEHWHELAPDRAGRPGDKDPHRPLPSPAPPNERPDPGVDRARDVRLWYRIPDAGQTRRAYSA